MVKIYLLLIQSILIYLVHQSSGGNVTVEKDTTTADKDSTTADKNTTTADKDTTIADKDTTIYQKAATVINDIATVTDETTTVRGEKITIIENESTTEASNTRTITVFKDETTIISNNGTIVVLSNGTIIDLTTTDLKTNSLTTDSTTISSTEEAKTDESEQATIISTEETPIAYTNEIATADEEQKTQLTNSTLVQTAETITDIAEIATVVNEEAAIFHQHIEYGISAETWPQFTFVPNGTFFFEAEIIDTDPIFQMNSSYCACKQKCWMHQCMTLVTIPQDNFGEVVTCLLYNKPIYQMSADYSWQARTLHYYDKSPYFSSDRLYYYTMESDDYRVTIRKTCTSQINGRALSMRTYAQIEGTVNYFVHANLYDVEVLLNLDIHVDSWTLNWHEGPDIIDTETYDFILSLFHLPERTYELWISWKLLKPKFILVMHRDRTFTGYIVDEKYVKFTGVCQLNPFNML